MNTMNFLKETIEDIKPKLALGDNPSINFLDLTIGEFSKLREAIYSKYQVLIRINHMFECLDLLELARKIETLPKTRMFIGA